MTIGLQDLRTGEGSSRLAAIKARHQGFDPEVEARVASILAGVRDEGDAALRRFCREFEGRDPASFRTAPARGHMEPAAAQAFQLAAGRIRRFHEAQRGVLAGIQDESGLGIRTRPLGSVGLYVPGGKALYPSTVLMNAIPAQVAGVARIAVVTPRLDPAIAWVLDLLGLHEVYEIGGAQAIGALAYGTESIPRVDKIVGPGNAWVAAAKRQVFGTVAIDSVAGPSEIVVVASTGANPAWVAADLLSQAEHDELASAVAITWDPTIAAAIVTETNHQLAALARRDIAAESLARHGAVFLVDSAEAAVGLVDDLAPEHLELMGDEAEALVDRIRHAGAIFIGPWSAEVVGDYMAGPNHVLPTNGTARFASPLGVWDFVVRTSIIHLDEATFRTLQEPIAAMADVEQLDAHARAARIR